ncbi:putative F-box domain, leucine-rich repeat domain superfamily, F-box-like domain superfamily [Helianthus anomalus]
MAERLDIITRLPQAIIETILCLLPTEEAARTSILSKEWRICKDKKNMRCRLFYVINQVLLLRRSPIHEFTLSMDAHDTCFEIDQNILHLSRNHTVKKLTLYFNELSSYGLPLSFFSSLHHLTSFLRVFYGNSAIIKHLIKSNAAHTIISQIMLMPLVMAIFVASCRLFSFC